MAEQGPRIGFDIGGTFTDVIVVHPDGTVRATKILSVDGDLLPSVCAIVNETLHDSGRDRLASLVHATTVCSNALLEGTFATIGLLTTEGFRDEMELRRQARPLIYDFGWERLAPLVARRRRMEVAERIDADGAIRHPLDSVAARAGIERLLAQGVEALAICCINSHVDPSHEYVLEGLARELAPDLDVCTSAALIARSGEYERMSTTCVNASLLPVVRSNLDEIEKQMAGLAASVGIMQSNGGLMPLERARREPVRMIESGPAAGALCAAALARDVGLTRVVSFDMGGTTVKGCLIEDAQPVEKVDYEVGGDANAASRYDRGRGYAVAVPSFDIVEAGAGGGSIAWFDGGVLHVGPRSAGAVPGPACYGRGGTEPTVTDANVALGYINPGAIAGNTVALDPHAAAAALQPIAGALGGTLHEAAHGVFEVANALMMRTVRAVTTERGRDPREYAMVSFGGSGPVHAASLATMLAIDTVYVPLFPGLFSALGLLIADVRYDQLWNVSSALHALDPDALGGGRHALGQVIGRQATDEGLDPGAVTVQWSLDMRYQGQGTDVVVPIGDENRPEAIAELFHAHHEALYGYRQSSSTITVASLRARAHAPSGGLSFTSLATAFFGAGGEEPAPESARMAYFGGPAPLHTRVVQRRALVGGAIEGPLIIEEPDTTIVVPPGWRASIDELANVVMRPA